MGMGSSWEASKEREMMFRIFYLFDVLYKMRILSPRGLYRVIAAILQYGINVMMLVQMAAKANGHKVAVVDERETITYHQLLSESEQLSLILQQEYGITSGQKVGFICKNHASLVKSIFAVSLAGADIYLFHTEMSVSQFNQLLDAHEVDFLIYDAELTSFIEQSSYAKEKVLSYHDH